MPKRKYFSYIRVSTQRQGQHGTSLVEQQAAIEKFATSWNLPIVRRFEERETAAKQGRPVFLEMLRELKRGLAHGVIIHKIDRSARNLKDWADLGSLIDSGLEVHFASESVDLASRGGRLSADIQAVVASDYIRNLKEETKKGIYGRLKQGLFPFRAMVGYLDRGPGQPKGVDPDAAPLIREAFELYATGDWSIGSLTDRMNALGLKTRSNKPLTSTGLATILHNPFYMGVIRINKTGTNYVGIHQPIITKGLFDDVQRVFSGKAFKTEKRHFFIFRRLIRCGKCTHLMTPETQKGIVYYRCHTRDCTPGCLRESKVLERLRRILRALRFSEEEFKLMEMMVIAERRSIDREIEIARARLERKQTIFKDRYSRLADAYIDGVFDEATYTEKKNELLSEELDVKEKLVCLSAAAGIDSLAKEVLELANTAWTSYQSAVPPDRRDLVKSLISEIVAEGKDVSIELKSPFKLIVKRNKHRVANGSRDARQNGLHWVSGLLTELMHLDHDIAQN